MVYGIGLNWASAMSQDESSSAAGPSLGQIVLLLFHNVFARYLPSQKSLQEALSVLRSFRTYCSRGNLF
jgi:hypothetical protein